MRILTMAKFDGSECVGLVQVRSTARILAILARRGYVEISREEYEQLLALKRAKTQVRQND